MTEKKMWDAEINITETGSEVRAEARLRGKEGGQMVGQGTARRNPTDEDVPAIGDELSAARALSDLSQQLLQRAAHDIEVHTAKPVERLRS
ncbi:DUF1876 domain-containing protein [Streptomyces sp. NPDC101150]|uniref:DUF1876 domain-containing protein n=1 Tax=Streptomyces sp. NPDC101150 TaxID=3366114 RepID=UPI003803E5CD